ncbi:hypothetical protein BGZ93_010617, partial [Podila epicladia]
MAPRKEVPTPERIVKSEVEVDVEDHQTPLNKNPTPEPAQQIPEANPMLTTLYLDIRKSDDDSLSALKETITDTIHKFE